MKGLIARARLLGLAGTALATCASQAMAQDTASPAAPASADDTAAADIVVTGSRIRRPDYEAPNPIVSLDSANLQRSGNTNITNFLQRVPALTGSRDSTQTAGGDAVYSNPFGAAGLNQLNLRNLGVNRTLVLVDGRRHVAGEPSTAAVDINSIPTDLIERVDVLTGTASAVYGADGVSGVVNFIMKRDFDGVAARSQFGISRYGDAGNRFASIAAGKNFADGRGNITFAYEYNADERLENDDRSFLRQNRRRYLIPNDADSGDSPSVPDNILVGDLRYGGESPNGAIFIGPEGSPSFNGDGRPYAAGTPAAYYVTGGDSSPVAGFYSGDLLPRIRRQAANVLTHYDFSDAFKVSLEGKYARTRARTFDYITGTYYYPIAFDNPYIPATIRQAAIAAGTPGAPAEIHINRDNFDYGRHGEDDLRETYRAVLDVSGRLGGHATYDLYYTYGRTDVRITKLNSRLGVEQANAIDAVRDPVSGEIVCRSRAAGCIPVNLFGAGPTDQAALDYFQIDDVSQARITQQVVSGSVSGDFGQFFSLPGGPIQFSFGGEYRRETSRFDPSDNLLSARFFQFDEPSLVTRSRGSFDVKEAFGEVNVPILKDIAFAQLLSVGAAGRYSDYSTIGHTDTWQVNGIYAPIRDISFRGSYGKAVRAPNIGELFQPTTGASNFFIDPCGTSELNNGTSFRAANCTALLGALGVTDRTGLQTASNVNGLTSGNPNLQPETARTWTAGVVLRPRFLEGLSLSADWYHIALKGAISTASPQQLAELCVDQPVTANPFCAAITRTRGTGVISSYVVSPQNVARFETAGLDVNLSYLLRTDSIGTFDFRIVGGYLDKLTFIGIPGADPIDNSDRPGSPRWNFNLSPTWTLGTVSINYNLRYANATRAFSRETTAGDPDYAPAAQLRISELWQHDAQVRFDLDGGFGFYAGVNNVTDQRPDEGNGTDQPISPLGRYFYAGVRVGLGKR